MPTLLKWQLDSLIYEILYEYVDPGLDLHFGNHIVQEIEAELNEAGPYDEVNFHFLFILANDQGFDAFLIYSFFFPLAS